MGMRDGRRVGSSGNQSGDMGHVHKEVGSNRICNFAKAWKVNRPGIRAGTGGDHFGANGFGLLGEGVVIDDFGLLADPVMMHFVEFAREIGFVTVGEVSAVGKVHCEDAVAGGQHAEINRHVRLAPAVGLDVGVFGLEQRLCALNGQRFHDVHVFTAPIPTFPRITLGVFVGETGPLRFHHSLTCEVLAGDEFNVFELTVTFLADRLGDGRVGDGKGGGF